MIMNTKKTDISDTAASTAKEANKESTETLTLNISPSLASQDENTTAFIRARQYA
jgi:hypothetical protein